MATVRSRLSENLKKLLSSNEKAENLIKTLSSDGKSLIEIDGKYFEVGTLEALKEKEIDSGKAVSRNLSLVP